MGRRQFHRYSTTTYIGVYVASSNGFLGSLEDISYDGIRISCKEPVGTNTLMRIRLQLPKIISGRTDLILDVRTVWSLPEMYESMYGAGFEILELSSNGLAVIEGMLSDEGFKFTKKPLMIPSVQINTE